MFDLFRRKDTNLRIVLGVLLGLVALSMVVTLIPGFGSSGINMGAGEETVAKVCGDPITAREVRLKVQQMLNKQQLPPESAAIFIPQFVDQYVAVKGVACFAGESGLTASEKEIALKIQKDVPALWQDGKFVGGQMYAQMLKQAGLTVAQFEDSIKKDIETQRLRNLVLMSAVATPKEVEDFFKESEEKIKLEYTVIDPLEVGKGVKIPEEELKAEFEKNKSSFTLPETRNVSMYKLDASKAQSNLVISEAELKQLYNENIENFRSPERVRSRHILFKTQDKNEAEEKKIRALADTVYKQLKSGAKFEELAAKYSEDPGSKANGGSIGFVTRGQATKNYDEYIFSAQPNVLSSPIKTEFGYHLIEVQEKLPAGMRSFEEVRPALEADLRQSKNTDLLGRTADQIKSELAKSNGQTSATAQKLGVEAVKFEYGAEQTSIPGLGPKPELFAEVRKLKLNEASDPITVGEGSMAVLVVNQIVASRPATFEQVKESIRGTKVVTASLKLVEDLKQKGAAIMNAPGADLSRIAKELGTSVKETQEFNRQGFADGLGPASAVTSAFGKKPGDLVGPLTVDNKWFFVRVVSKKDADLSQLPARRSEIVNLVKNRKASERADIFEETLVKRMIKDGKIAIIEDAKKRVASGYGG